MRTTCSTYAPAYTRRAGIAVLVLLGLALSRLACSAASSGEVPPAGVPVPFTDVTETAGLAGFRHENGAVGNKWYPEMMGSGGGFLDYDGDDWPDILLLGGGTWDNRPVKAIWLFRNNGDGTFTDVTEAAGLAGIRAYTLGLAVADYDNDGDQDFLVTNLDENMLFRNNGDGTFTEVGREAGIANNADWSSSALFFDADRDGHLDLYIGGYVPWTPETDKFCPEGGAVKLYCVPADYDGVPSRFYRNNGDGTFTERTAEAGFLPAPGKSLGVVELDYNDDGWPDLAVANDGEGDLLYENNGDGTFTEKGVVSGFAFSEHGEARAGMGIDAGVVDPSGHPTLFVGNFSEEMVGVYRYTGDGFFLNRDAASRIGYPSLLTLTFGLFLADLDLDADLDLLLANGHVYPDRLAGQDKITFRQRPQVFLNRGDGVFDEFVAEAGPLTRPLVARGAAYADIDRDGDLDVLLTENDGPAHLWRNDLPGGHVLRVHVEGRQSNRSGLGTRLRVRAGGQWQERRLQGGSSYLSQSERVATFGLAGAVEALWVRWPSGLEEEVSGVEGYDVEVWLVEGEGVVRRRVIGRAGSLP
ncbi:MAG: RNA-binding protein [Rhodothermaceae bacterium]|nr:MAG: RNA-binding protein [Rhodothermaceae bacterium]